MDDIVQLIIYLLIGLVGIVASAYRKGKRQQARPPVFPGESNPKSQPEVMPDLGPLSELFGIPEPPQEKSFIPPGETEPTVEDHATIWEEQGLLEEQKGLELEAEGALLESTGFNQEKIEEEGTSVFAWKAPVEPGDIIHESAIDDVNELYNAIAASEIRDADSSAKSIDKESINWRKAVIYSEILKRREI